MRKWAYNPGFFCAFDNDPCTIHRVCLHHRMIGRGVRGAYYDSSYEGTLEHETLKCHPNFTVGPHGDLSCPY